MTTEEALQLFKDYLIVERDRSQHTVRAYTSDVREFMEFVSRSGIDLFEVEHTDLRAFFAEITGAGMHNGHARKRKLDARSQRRKLASVRTFYSFLVLRDIMSNNPAKEIRSPRMKKKLPGFIPYEEMRTLLEDGPDRQGNLAAERKIRDTALMEILYSSGMRISEALSLDVMNESEDLTQLKILGKGRRERIIFLGDSARAALVRYLKVRDQFRPATQKLFVNRNGGPLSDRGVRKIMVELQRASGLQRRVHPHRFRHSMATDLLNEGADIRAVQELLGHRSLASTQVYTGVSKDRLKEVYRRSHPHGRALD